MKQLILLRCSLGRLRKPHLDWLFSFRIHLKIKWLNVNDMIDLYYSNSYLYPSTCSVASLMVGALWTLRHCDKDGGCDEPSGTKDFLCVRFLRVGITLKMSIFCYKKGRKANNLANHCLVIIIVPGKKLRRLTPPLGPLTITLRKVIRNFHSL